MEGCGQTLISSAVSAPEGAVKDSTITGAMLAGARVRRMVVVCFICALNTAFRRASRVLRPMSVEGREDLGEHLGTRGSLGRAAAFTDWSHRSTAVFTKNWAVCGDLSHRDER